jgi:hypothetical protein
VNPQDDQAVERPEVFEFAEPGPFGGPMSAPHTTGLASGPRAGTARCRPEGGAVNPPSKSSRHPVRGRASGTRGAWTRDSSPGRSAGWRSIPTGPCKARTRGTANCWGCVGGPRYSCGLAGARDRPRSGAGYGVPLARSMKRDGRYATDHRPQHSPGHGSERIAALGRCHGGTARARHGLVASTSEGVGGEGEVQQ